MSIPMTNQIDEMDEVIDLQDYSNQNDSYDNIVDMNEYSNSSEGKEAGWIDYAKDFLIQPSLGAAKAFTWPLDVLKLGMVGEALTDLDELEDAFKKAGKTFDRNEYLREVAKESEFIPTQDLLEQGITKFTGVDLKPKTEAGKWINKFFTLSTLLKGQGLAKAATSGAAGATTTSALKSAGVNETASDLIGDATAGGVSALKKSPRIFSPEVAAIEKTASKNGLPFPEYLTRETKDLVGPKISQARRDSLTKELGMSSQEAIDQVIAGKLPVSKLRSQGADLEVLVDDSYDRVSKLLQSKPNPVATNNIVKDIDMEISRIRKKAPSASDADEAAIGILQREKGILEKSSPTSEQLVQQIKNYNSNVSTIYRRPEFSGKEDSVRGAYAFLNNSIRNTIESESGQEVRNAMRAADAIYGEKAKLDRVEGLVSKAFVNGEYSPKKLSQLLNSKQGLVVRRELGDQAVNEIRDIARYGEASTKSVAQLAKSSKHISNIAEWGPLAGFLLYKMPKTAGVILAAKPLGNRIRGYLMTRPATRTVYRDILKNAAKGSYKTMPQDFAKLESAITKDFGSIDDFFDTMMDDLELIQD